MHTKEAITFALTLSNKAVLSVIDEMSGAPTAFPTQTAAVTRCGCWVTWR